MKQQITITGKNIYSIASFYEEINRAFMQNENWKIGESLDALNDLLHGGFGIMGTNKDIALTWTDIELSRAALGYETTRAYYLNKLKPQSPFNKSYFQTKLDALEAGNGQTYFDIILEIIAGHPNIELITD